MVFSLLGSRLDQKHGGQDEKSTRNRRESNIPEVVRQHNEDRHQTETAPTCQPADPFAEAHESSPEGDDL
jgi:hypothetical protein